MTEIFNNLNYTFNNEDSEFEARLLKEKQKVLVVAGSGGRVLSLLSRQPKEICIVDKSKEQIFLTELKIETIKKLTYNEYLFFWNPYLKNENSKRRIEIFEKLKLNFKTEKYFRKIFKKNNWETILYIGKWESKFRKVAKLNNFITRKKILPIFEIKNIEKYSLYLKNKFPWKRFKFSLWLLGRGVLFNQIMYKGKFPKNNLGFSNSKFYIKIFETLFNKFPLNNFFLELLFFGHIINNLSFEFKKENFKKIKAGIENSKIKYFHSDFEKVFLDEKDFDFIASSDIISYYSDKDALNFLNKISNNISKKGIIINRNYLNIPKINLNNFNDISKKFEKEISEEKTQMYKIKIYQKR